jgi:threonine synthase
LRYISTRGEAPALNFVDCLLAGLASDGGLYLPESYPQLHASTIAGLAGRPYAEAEIIMTSLVVLPFRDTTFQ